MSGPKLVREEPLHASETPEENQEGLFKTDRRRFLAGMTTAAGLALATSASAQDEPKELAKLAPLSKEGRTTDKIETFKSSFFYPGGLSRRPG